MKKILFIAALLFTMNLTFGQTTMESGNTWTGNISMNNFKAIVTDAQSIELTWATMMESGVSHFEIQRSGDGINFQDMDSVRSKMDISTSDYQLTYNYTDIHPLSGTTYYRIKVVGVKGNFTLSAIVQVNHFVPGTRIYPTVIQSNTVFIETDKTLQDVTMELFDINGNKINEMIWQTLYGRQSVQVSKSGNLHSGTYIIRLMSRGQNIKSQMVIMQNN